MALLWLVPMHMFPHLALSGSLLDSFWLHVGLDLFCLIHVMEVGSGSVDGQKEGQNLLILFHI